MKLEALIVIIEEVQNVKIMRGSWKENNDNENSRRWRSQSSHSGELNVIKRVRTDRKEDYIDDKLNALIVVRKETMLETAITNKLKKML